MGQEEQDRRIDYLEFPARDIPRIREFYETVFGWKFTDYGSDYTSFHDGRLAGGFRTDVEAKASWPLVVLYATDLSAVEEKIKQHGGEIVKATFEFPGGHRFHFLDPTGNELAVWSDK